LHCITAAITKPQLLSSTAGCRFDETKHHRALRSIHKTKRRNAAKEAKKAFAATTGKFRNNSNVPRRHD
jgi:hypothetical protein